MLLPSWMIEREVAFLRFFQNYRAMPPLNVFVSLVSPSPAYDIFIIVPIVAVVHFPRFGFDIFWTIFLAASFQHIFDFIPSSSTKSVVEISNAIEPLTRPCRGIISSESYWSTVVFTFLAFRTEEGALVVLYFAAIFLVGFTRIVATSQFPHQVVAGVCAGALVDVAWSGFCRAAFRSGSPSLTFHIVGLFVLASVSALIFTLRVESNRHRYVGIRRNEYVSVLKSIVQNKDVMNARARKESARGFNSMGTLRRDLRRDSFYNLSKTMRRRNGHASTEGVFAYG